MNHYETVAQIIRYLDQHQDEQPDLETLGVVTGLSVFHLHRLFSEWAGVTPKDFLQCLTFERLKAALGEGYSVLDAALDAGLSGPGRAHDLCVTLAAASPGEIKSGGANLEIVYGFASTPFGRALIGDAPRGICHLSFVEKETDAAALDGLRREWSAANFKSNDQRAVQLAAQIFGNEPWNNRPAKLRAFVRGTEFQLRVWHGLLRTPSGRLTTYGKLARDIDVPGASRAVGSAVGSNAIAYLIPCHRVIRGTGIMGQYKWDAMRKRAMIGWEQSRRANARPEMLASASGF